MVQLYVKLVREGKKKLEQVPPIWREEVRKIIEGEDII